jgi:hypothetical protein
VIVTIIFLYGGNSGVLVILMENVKSLIQPVDGDSSKEALIDVYHEYNDKMHHFH